MTSKAPRAFSARDVFVKTIATFFGAGYSPLGPGTVGSLAGLFIAWHAGTSIGAYLVVFTILGFAICKPATRVFNSGDPSKFVMDEVCGMMLTLLLIPHNPYLFIAGFVLFRFFDILKPWPISVIQRWKSPSAIMWDDLAAGVFANLILQTYLFFATGRAG